MALNQIVVTLVANAQQFIGQLRSAAQQTSQFSKQMTSGFQGAGKAAQDAGKQTEDFTGKLGKMGKEVIGNIARFTAYYLAVGQLTKFVGGAVEELRQMDANLHNIQSITLESDARIRELAKDLLGMVLSGQSAGKSASELAAAMYELTSAGYSSSDAMALAKVSAEGAAAGLTTTDKASKALLTILQAYKLPVSSATEVMNQLFVIVDKGVLHFDDLVTNLGYVIPAAAALKVPLSELGAAIELLTRQGQQPSRVMTNLNDVMTRMLKPNKELAKAISDLGFSSGAAMVKEIGLTESVRLLAEYAGEPLTKSTKKSTKEIRALSEASSDASYKVKDAATRVERAEEALKITNDRLALARSKGAKNIPQLELAAKNAADNLARAQHNLSEAQKDVTLSNGKLADSYGITTQEVGDADAKLAAMFGDVRAIRAILPLAANDGRDFIAMLADHNQEAASGDRHLKALAQQQKSFNYQLNQLTSNLKALAVVFGAPLLAIFGRWLTSINELFKKLVIFDEESQHFMFIWEKNPQIIEKAKLAFALIAIVLVAKLLPAITSVMKALDLLGPMLKMTKFLGPWGLLAAAIIGVLIYFGLLDDAIAFLKVNGAKAVDYITKKFEEFKHFFELGFTGGILGGGTAFQQFATKVGQGAKDIENFLGDVVVKAKELGRLFLLGFAGGSLGGNVDGLSRLFVDAGKAAHDFITFILNEALPRALDFAKAVWEGFITRIIADFNTFKDLIVAFINSNLAAELWASFKEGVGIWRDLVSATKPFFQLILDNSESIGQFVGRFIEIAAVIRVLAIIFLALTSPIGMIIAAFIALTIAMGYVSRHADEIKAKIRELWDSMPAIVLAIAPVVVAAFHFIVEMMKTEFTLGFEFVKGLLANFFTIMSGMVDIFAGLWQGDWSRVWEGVKQVVSGVWAQIKLTVETGIALVVATLENAWPLFVAAISALPGIIIAAMELAVPAWMKIGLDIGMTIGGAIVDGLKAGLKALSSVKIKIPAVKIKGVTLVPGFEVGFDLLGFAKGVRDFAGGMAMVGEHGPEAVFLPPGSSVASAGKTSHIMDNMSGSRRDGVNVTFAPVINDLDIDSIVRSLHAEADRAGAQMRLRSLRKGAPLSGRL